MNALPVVVIGGGVAGCAAAVASAETGAKTILLETNGGFGGVAGQGEHRTLCGLAPIDSSTPDLLEPELTGQWIGALTNGPAFRQGRVWLWPTDARTLKEGLWRRVQSAGVEVRLGYRKQGERIEGATITGHSVELRMTDGRKLAVSAVIDASGGPFLARLLGLPTVAATQWPAYRSLLHLPMLGTGTAARVTALRTAQVASGGDAALALTPVDPVQHHWQLSLDVAPGTSVSTAAMVTERVAAALGGRIMSQATTIAERDSGRPVANIDLPELFAERERGLCWAAWPREEHGPAGVAWTWPAHDRHGVPERVARIPGAPATVWCVGKGAAVTVEAAAALRVTGTCLALGAAVGRQAALSARSDRAR